MRAGLVNNYIFLSISLLFSKMKDTAFIEQMLQKGNEVKEKMRIQLSRLHPSQLVWTPSTPGWSIAECIEHLLIADGLRINIIEKKIATNFKNNKWEELNPLKGFWGSILITQTQEKVKKKIKSPHLFFPANTINADDLIIRFENHLDKILSIINNCVDTDIDLSQVTSPVSKLVTYSLRNAIIIIIGHEQRHINQAIRLSKTAGFPSK